MLFKWLKNRAEKRQSYENIYTLAANHARHPLFYQDYCVADSITGRYELLCLHVYLLLERLRHDENQRHISQALTEILVKELERAYRDNGFQDLSIPKNIKMLIAGFYERATSYKNAIAAQDLEQLAHNLNLYVYQGKNHSSVDDRAIRLAIYTQAANDHLKTIPLDDFETGNFAFISPDMESL